MTNEEGKEAMSVEGKEGTGIGGRLAVLAGDAVADAALGVLFERVAAAVGSAQCGAGGQGPAVVELDAGDAARLLRLAMDSGQGAARGVDALVRVLARDEAGKLEQLSGAVAKLLGACGAIKAGRGRPVSVASALADLRVAYWRVSGQADELARRDAAAAGLVSGAVSGLPAAQQLGVA